MAKQKFTHFVPRDQPKKRPGCSTVLHLRLLRVEEQEETLVNIKHTTEFPHVFTHEHYTKLSHVCTKNGKIKI